MIEFCTRPRTIFGEVRCRFEPRYDVGAAEGLQSIKYTGPDPRSLYEAMRPKTYVRDVCVRCGKTIERGQS